MRDELRDPWAILLALTAGGVAWAISVPIAASAVIAVAVWAAYVGLSLVTNRRPAVAGPRVDPRSLEAGWLRRGHAAADRFADVARGISAGPVAERAAQMGARLDDTVRTLERLAANASTASRALDNFDPSHLAAERQRLRTARRERPDLADDYTRALRSVEAQQEIYNRLAAARDKALARLESGAIGLEGLVARIVELSTLADTGPAEGVDALADLAGELDGIRAGLAEAEQITSQALGAYRNERPIN